MFRVYLHSIHRWIENVPAIEAAVFKEDGFLVERMDEVIHPNDTSIEV